KSPGQTDSAPAGSLWQLCLPHNCHGPPPGRLPTGRAGPLPQSRCGAHSTDAWLSPHLWSSDVRDYIPFIGNTQRRGRPFTNGRQPTWETARWGMTTAEHEPGDAEGVYAELSYVSPHSRINRRYVAPGREVNTGTYETHRVFVRNGRTASQEFSLDSHGFVLARHRSKVEHFRDRAQVDRKSVV